MTGFRLVDASAKEVWSTKFMQEYVRTSGFLPYMSSKDNAIIRSFMELTGENGETVHVPYFASLRGDGLTGSTTSYGNEDDLKNYSKAITARYKRNVVMVPESENYKTDLDVADVVRSSLVEWSARKLTADLIAAGNSVVIKGDNDADGLPGEDRTKSYDAASAAERNAYLTNNSDRILFGHQYANNTGTYSTSLANIDPTKDRLSAKVLRLAKRMAKKTDQFKITPVRTMDTREYFTLFVGTEGFTDLSNDDEIQRLNREARPRDVDSNPLFQSGDILLDGIVVREIPEMPAIVGAGVGGSNVGTAWLMGSNALGVVWAKKPEPRVEKRDLGLENRLGIVEIRGQDKLSAGGVQTGMVTLHYSAIGDA